MSQVDAELDAFVMQLMLRSAHGRKWLAMDAERAEAEHILIALHRRGLDPGVLGMLAGEASADLLRRVSEASPAEIAALNAAARHKPTP